MAKVKKANIYFTRHHPINNNNNVSHRSRGNQTPSYVDVPTQTSFTSLPSHTYRQLSSHSNPRNSQRNHNPAIQLNNQSSNTRANRSSSIARRSRSKSINTTPRRRNSDGKTSINSKSNSKTSLKKGTNGSLRKTSNPSIKITSLSNVREPRARNLNFGTMGLPSSSAAKVKTPNRQSSINRRKVSKNSNTSRSRKISNRSAGARKTRATSNRSQNRGVKSRPVKRETSYNNLALPISKKKKCRTSSKQSKRSISSSKTNKQRYTTKKRVTSKANDTELPRFKKYRQISAKTNQLSARNNLGDSIVKKSETQIIKENDLIRSNSKRNNSSLSLPMSGKSCTHSQRFVMRAQPVRTSRSVTKRLPRSLPVLKRQNKPRQLTKCRQATRNRNITKNRKNTTQKTAFEINKVLKESSSFLLDQQILSMKGFGPVIVDKLKNKGIRGEQGLQKMASELTKYSFNRWFTAEVGGNKSQAKLLSKMFSTQFHRKPRNPTTIDKSNSKTACRVFDVKPNSNTTTTQNNIRTNQNNIRTNNSKNNIRTQPEQIGRIENSAPMAPYMVINKEAGGE